jgi:hypothetical protein
MGVAFIEVQRGNKGVFCVPRVDGRIVGGCAERLTTVFDFRQGNESLGDLKLSMRRNRVL